MHICQVLENLKGSQYEGTMEYLEGGAEVINILFPFGGIDGQDKAEIESNIPKGFSTITVKGRGQAESVIIYKIL